MKIRRELVAQNRDAFLPDLAMSMGMLGQTLDANKREAEALEAFAEGIRTIREPLEILPQAFIGLGIQLARDYQRLAEKLGAEVDQDLLWPVVEVAMKLQSEQEES